MDDGSYTRTNPAIDPFLLSDVQDLTADDSPPRAVDTSPDIPLLGRRREPQHPVLSPSPQKLIDLSQQLGLGHLDMGTIVGPYENARGKAGASGRTLRQRLGDLKKMSDLNQARGIEQLRADLSMSNVANTAERDEVAQPVFKRPRIEVEPDPPKPFLHGHPVRVDDRTVRPADVFGDTFTDPEAILTQSRIDLALASGASSDGHLLRRIASTSPQRTPKKKTRASALANSPTTVAVKEQKPKGPQTPQMQQQGVLGAVRTPGQGDGSPTKSARRVNPEQHLSEAIKAFEMPQSCRGSCVTYAEDEKVTRQVTKARGGWFSEEVLLVGMRFVVV